MLRQHLTPLVYIDSIAMCIKRATLSILEDSILFH